jgi:hypothetical protein
MSLFDDLKIQAQKALEAQTTTDTLSAEVISDRNTKLKEIHDYWREFVDLIKVIQPDFPDAISLPSIGDMSGLKILNPFYDCRHKSQITQSIIDEIDYVVLYFFYRAPQAFTFKKEVGALVTRVKDVLWRYGIVHTVEDIKNAQERIVEVNFNIPWQVKGSVTVTPFAQSKALHFSLKNIGKLGEVELEMPFEKIDREFLDELSKLLLGQENRFWKLAKF